MLDSIARRLGFARETTQVEVTEIGIRDWMIKRLAQELKVDESQVSTTKRFDEYGLDSRVAIQVSGELEKIVERRLSPALLFEYPTIEQVAQALVSQLDEIPDA